MSDAPHFVHEAVCLYCTKKWIAVAPVGTTELECPQCGKMGFARKARVYNIFGEGTENASN